MADKIYKKLPGILQTNPIKNFFETTVEQLYSKANVEPIKGYIGTQTSNDASLSGAFINQSSSIRSEYSLTPIVNNLNANSGVSENFIFYDEFVQTLDNYGVNTDNHNKLFGTEFQSFNPPIDIDKLINYQEYYWDEDGPKAIDVSGSLANPLNVSSDIIGKANFTPNSGKKIPFKNGMVICFKGDYIIPNTFVGNEYIVEGVGTSIHLVAKDDNFNTRFATALVGQWDATAFTVTNVNVVYSASNVSTVSINTPGVGYVNPSVTLPNVTGHYANIATANISANAIGAITNIAITNANVSHLYTGEIGLVVADTGTTANVNESETFNGASTVEARNVVLDSITNFKVGQIASIGSATAIIKSVNNDGISTIDFAGESNIRTPGNYANVTSASSGGSGATFDVIIDSGIATVNNIGGANTNRSAGTYANVSAEHVRNYMSNAEIEASTGGSVVGVFSNATTSYSLSDIVVFNDYYYRMLRLDYNNSNPDWPQAPLGTSKSTTYWQIVPSFDISEGAGATFDITINGSGAATSVTSNLKGDGYVVGETVTIDIADLGGANSNISGDLAFDVASVTGNVTTVTLNEAGSGYTNGDVITVADTQLGGNIANALQFTANVVSDSITLTDVTSLSNANLSVHAVGTGFSGEVRTDAFSFSADANGNITVTLLDTQHISGVNPDDPNDFYLKDGTYSFDKDTDGDGEGDQKWGGSLGQIKQDYVTLGRGSKNKNVWSRVNFWYHKENYLDAGDDLPIVSKRAKRPILEYKKDIELYNHGVQSRGTVLVSAGDYLFDDINGMSSNVFVDGVALGSGSTIIFPKESLAKSKYVYQVTANTTTQKYEVSHLPDPVDSTQDFTFVDGDTVSVKLGQQGIGKEYYYSSTEGLVLAQEKINLHQPPLFNLYDENKKYLGDNTEFFRSDFAGNKVFSFTEATGEVDSEYNYALSYKQFKTSSEISYSNFLNDTVSYRPQGETESQIIPGEYFYKLTKDLPEYHSLFVNTKKECDQKIVARYTYTRDDLDTYKDTFDIGCVPNTTTFNSSGYDITVTVNGIVNTNWTYLNEQIIFTVDQVLSFNNNDLIDIVSYSTSGRTRSINNISTYELPVVWHKNPNNKDVVTIAEPEFIPHFKELIEEQDGFTGSPLESNNFRNTAQEPVYGKKIIQSNDNLMLASFLVDDQPHNLMDSLNFVSKEYTRYKRRLVKEIDNQYNLLDFNNLSNEEILEIVLKKVISFSVGKNVFNKTYMLPFGDNYVVEKLPVQDTATKLYTTSKTIDTTKIENSVLVYHTNGTTNTLLNIDRDYTITSTSPLAVTFTSDYTPTLGAEIVFKFYDKDRDSAQCPPTPSVTGMYSCYQPEIIEDKSFVTPRKVLVGHDGSKSKVFNDRRDDILLEFENRIYNNILKEFRTNNHLPELNVVNVRPGKYRENITQQIQDWHDLLNQDFENWVFEFKVDAVKNEFYDETNEFTWNYRSTTETPGHWRGWYEYHYDTVRPHTHPWEMLGFTSKPTWWDTQYISSTYSDYSSSNAPMWEDLEKGIIRQGDHANVDGKKYKENNPYRRIGLSDELPVDESANLLSPKAIKSTDTTTKTVTFVQTTPNTTQGYVTTSYLLTDGVNVKYDTNNVYVVSNNIPNFDVSKIDENDNDNLIREQQLTYSITRPNLTSVSESGGASLPDNAVGVLVNGLPLNNHKGTSYDTTNTWHYDVGYQKAGDRANGIIAETDSNGVITTTVPNNNFANTSVWGTTASHSGIVGWAFDGLPIYGPYGYTEYHANGQIKNSTITNIKSSFELKPGLRGSGPGGAHTGVFVEDYQHNPALASTPGYAGKYNHRYGVTPDSPTNPIRYYVTTVDSDGKALFPYAVGGGTTSFDGSNVSYNNSYFAVTNDLDNNSNHKSNVNSSATSAISSQATTTFSKTTDVSEQWQFGDNAPVENAWRSSERYPFAVVEALFLSKPGKFATVFANPVHITKSKANPNRYISTASRKVWDFTDRTDFPIHGTLDSNNNIVTSSGYTTFIHSYLRHKNIDISNDFVNRLNNLNIKLGHRFAGFVDKDTMTLSLDQFSTTGESKNLLLPSNDIDIIVHNSPHKSRNSYSGVIVEKTSTGYKVKGYDKDLGYFNILESDKTKGRERVEVGGEKVDFTVWQKEKSYQENTIVKYKDTFFQAKEFVPSTAEFNFAFWKKLRGLPTIKPAGGTLYQETTGVIKRVYYNYEYTDIEDVFDFLISLGRYQSSQGYNFNEAEVGLSRPSDWRFSAESFLFWTTGKWEVGNTVELSPMASKVRFVPQLGYTAEIKKISNDQFNIVDREGKAINPKDCDILREDNKVVIIPPAGIDIYGITLFTRETEHAMAIENVTEFNDTVFDTFLDQRHERLKVKGSKTANWDGRLLSEGFIINDDELIPNLDNLAETSGRYYEIGFVPVDKQLYEKSRQQFGYNERDYLNELDISDDEQFSFYKGMIQSKGTAESLSRIGRSNSIVQGSMTVYDEWAFKAGEFGDTQNNQSIELKIEKQDIVQDPQLITLAFPEDTTGTIDEITVLQAKHKYFAVPEVEITAPSLATGVQAKAVAGLDSNGLLSTITVTEKGSGYDDPSITVILSNVLVSNESTMLTNTDARSSLPITNIEYYSGNNNVNASFTGNANISSLSNVTITNELNSNVATINLTSITDVANIVTLINTDANINSDITAHLIVNDTADPGNSGNGQPATYRINKSVRISGADFTLADDNANATLGNLNLVAGNYQPRQRHAFDVAGDIPAGTGKTEVSNISVSVDGSVVASSNYDFDIGDRWQINNPTFIEGNTTYSLNVTVGILDNSDAIHTLNTTLINGANEYVDVYIDGEKINNHEDYYTANTSAITFTDVGKLPTGRIQPGANVYIVERATIDFKDSYKGDLPGSNVNIKVFTNDSIGIVKGEKRIYEITPDAKDDEVILIDIDDTSRFLKKPEGVRESNLWPTTGNVSHLGVTDKKYNPIPNAGYVKKANVEYQAFGIADISSLFDENIKFKPIANDHIHLAKSENKDWNVFKLEKANTNISFVEQADNTAYLYTDYSLFNYVDSNQLQESDLSRYLDYRLAIKNTNLSEDFVIWTNEQIVNKKAVRIKDWGGVNMVEAPVTQIGPQSNSVFEITAVSPAISNFRGGSLLKADANNIVTVSAPTGTDGMLDGDTVTILDAGTTEYEYNLVSTSYTEDVTVMPAMNNSAEALRTIVFSANDSLTYYEVKYSGNSAVIDVNSLEQGVFAADANASPIINQGNIILPANVLPASNTSVTFTRVKGDELKLTVSNINLHGASTLGVNSTIKLNSTTSSQFANCTFAVTSVDAANNSFIINSDTFLDFDLDEIIDTTDSAVWNISSISVIETSNAHGSVQTVSNVTARSFTFEDANITANISSANCTFGWHGRTTIQTANAHLLADSSMVKIIANGYSGYYFVQSPSANTFVINKPYVSNFGVSGNVITKGIEITAPGHGINAAYAGKRVAVHLMEPRTYNQVYKVSGVTANTILVDNAFAYTYEANTTSTAVVTSIDHNKVTLNGATIAVDNLNSEEAVVESFNRQMDLRRGFIVSDQMSMRFPMLKKLNKFTQDQKDGTPYLTGVNLPEKLKTNLQITGSMVIPKKLIAKKGFKKSPVVNNLNTIGSNLSTTATGIKLPQATLPHLRQATKAQQPVSITNNASGGFDKTLFNSFGNILNNFTGTDLNIKIPLVSPLKTTKQNGGSTSTNLPTTTTTGTSGTVGGSVSQNSGMSTLFNNLLNSVTNPGDIKPAVTQTTSTGSGSPVIDPTKAISQITATSCTPQQCAPVVEAGGGTTGGAGGFVNQPVSQPEPWGSYISVSGVTGTGKGKRYWGSKYSGYYNLIGDTPGSATQVGGGDRNIGVNQRGLFGARTWSDNGSTNSFSATITFTKVGKVYLHCFEYSRGSNNMTGTFVSASSSDTSKVTVNSQGSTTNQCHRTGSKQNPNVHRSDPNAIEIDIKEVGASITINATSRGGSNHWNAVECQLSGQRDTISAYGPTAVQAGGGTGNPPQNSNIVRDYIQQSTRDARTGHHGDIDSWSYEIKNPGVARIVFDMYSGTDGITVYGQSAPGIHGWGSVITRSTAGNIKHASGQDKTDLASGTGSYTNRGNNPNLPGTGNFPGQHNNPRQHWHGGNWHFGGAGSYSGTANNIKDFELAASSVQMDGVHCGVKHCGVLEFNVDPSIHPYIRIDVRKPSSVYRMFIDVPKAPPPADVPSNPEPSQDCDIPIHNPNAGTTATGTSTGGGTATTGTGNTGPTPTPTPVAEGKILAINVIEPGRAILNQHPNLAGVSGGGSTGSGATFSIGALTNGQISNSVITITDGGTGYRVGDVFQVTSVSFLGQIPGLFEVTQVETSVNTQTTALPQTPINNPTGTPVTTGGGGGGGSTNQFQNILGSLPTLGARHWRNIPTPKLPQNPRIDPLVAPYGKQSMMMQYKTIGNYSAFGQPTMAGFIMMPSALKKGSSGVMHTLPDGSLGRKTSKNVFNNQYGKYTELTGNRYVNNTVQKITGGKVVPLAQPLANRIPVAPNPLNGPTLDYQMYTNVFGSGPRGLIRAGDLLIDPQNISVNIGVGGRTIRNILNDDYDLITNINNLDLSYGLPPTGQVAFDLVEKEPVTLDPPEEIEGQIDPEILYNYKPGIILTPIKGKIPQDPALCEMVRPTPAVTLNIADMLGVKEGDGIIINGQSVTFEGTDPLSIVASLKTCANGANYNVSDTFLNGEPAIRISSCSNAPLTIREGCRGGTYKEVLDFHIVRGFTQTETSNTTVLPNNTGYAAYDGDSGSSTIQTNPTATYKTYDINGNITGTLNSITTGTQGGVLSSRSVTTGGSGYKVGDRLRLVGGTPVANPFGGVTEICVINPGSGYTKGDVQNIEVRVGDGTTPGAGCTTGGVILNDTGGIDKIIITAPGTGYDKANPPTVRIVDRTAGNTNANYVEAQAEVLIGMPGDKGVPARVAKFEVEQVDEKGKILALRVVDRGIYKVFPADLTQGVPLEYDVINVGDETGLFLDEDGNEIPNSHSQGTGLGQFDALNENATLPSASKDVQDLLDAGAGITSDKGYDPLRGGYGGGTGARVFLTAREIPDCSERGTAASTLGLPPRVVDANIPEAMTACFNRALEGAGYDPNDIRFDYEDINDEIGYFGPTMPGFDGIIIDETTPGFLDKLGIPAGTYNIDMLCMVATLAEANDPEATRISASAGGAALYDDETGLEVLANTTPVVLEISCIDTIGPFGPLDLLTKGGNGQDPGSIFGDGDVSFVTDLYQYELRDQFGDPISNTQLQQECDVLVFESARFDANDGANVSTLVNGQVTDALITSYDKMWIDNYNSTGWAYLEKGVVKYQQENLVDSKFVKNAMLYDAESGNREFDLYEYDPFKGIIPGFLEKEISYISENDPVVYNSAKANFGERQVGMVWWDTSRVSYQWYEQGTNRERWLNWGKAMPGSSIVLYEWVKSNKLPQNYDGTGTPRSANYFITEKIFNPVTDSYENCYYYWVHNKAKLDNEVALRLDRRLDTLTLARTLANPVGLGLPMISYVSDTSFVLHNVSQIVREDEHNLQINLSRNLNPVGNKHVAWKLVRENDNNCIIPDDLTLKMIDSLVGYNKIGQVVPDPLLSEVEAYGIKFRPRQSMFKDIKEARRMFVKGINEILADIKLNSNFPGWDKTLPASRTYIETVNWYEVDRINNFDNSKVRYDDSFKPVYQVGSANELRKLSGIPNDSIVQVLPNKTAMFELWKYVSSTDSFERIAIQNDTIKLKDTVFTDNTNLTMANELRLLINALIDNVFVNTANWNKLFFLLTKYAVYEQEQLDWAFKSSYIFIEKEEEDLIQFKGFKLDNFSKVTDYFDEVKPYTSKIRDYKDGKKTPIEFIGTNQLSDFDKPPYADPETGSVRILDDFLQSDSNIMQQDNAYINYFNFSNVFGEASPIRKQKTKIVFDRTHWNPHTSEYDPTKETLNTSIATNFVTLTAQTNAEVSANTSVRNVDRVFKFNTQVRNQFVLDLNEYFSVSDAGTNANIIGSVANVTTAIDNGALDTTLSTLKTNSDGDFGGTLVDASVFSKVVSGTDGTMTYQQQFGFDSSQYASVGYDPTITVKNFIGSFTAEPTYMVDNKLTDGFDGVTFQRVLYGEERPEELALFDPYETLVIRVLTDKNESGNASANVVSSNASTVKYQITMDLFGKTEYMRMLQDGSANTRITANFYTYSDALTVDDVTKLPDPIPGTPGVAWVGSERIEYTRKVGNQLKELKRGTKGTTVQNWFATDPETGNAVTVEVFDGSPDHIFTKAVPGNTVDLFNPDANVWLDTGAVSLADKGNANVSDNGSIMKFLHNL